MEKDFWLASRKFCQTVWRLRKGKQGLAQAVFSRGRELLTRTGDIVGRWKEELLNLTNTSSVEEADSEDSGEVSSICLAEVSESVEKLLSGKVPGVDEICPEMLKALDIVGLSWLTRLFSVETGKLGWWFTFSKKRTGGCAPIIGVSHCSATPGKLTPGCWKGDSGRLLNLRFRRSNVDSVLDMEQWTSSLPLQGCWGGRATVSLGGSCGGYWGSIGYRGCWYEPSGPCTTKVRAVFVFSYHATHSGSCNAIMNLCAQRGYRTCTGKW